MHSLSYITIEEYKEMVEQIFLFVEENHRPPKVVVINEKVIFRRKYDEVMKRVRNFNNITQIFPDLIVLYPSVKCISELYHTVPSYPKFL